MDIVSSRFKQGKKKMAQDRTNTVGQIKGNHVGLWFNQTRFISAVDCMDFYKNGGKDDVIYLNQKQWNGRLAVQDRGKKLREPMIKTFRELKIVKSRPYKQRLGQHVSTKKHSDIHTSQSSPVVLGCGPHGLLALAHRPVEGLDQLKGRYQLKGLDQLNASTS